MARKIERRIQIEASAGAVWELLADIDAWSTWNPLYARASGKFAIGEAIDMAVALPGMKPQPVSMVITEIVPQRSLRYETNGPAGMTRAERYVEIAKTASGRCNFTNGEIMSGPVGTLLGLLLGRRVGEGIAAMNAALKAKAEAAAPD